MLSKLCKLAKGTAVREALLLLCATLVLTGCCGAVSDSPETPKIGEETRLDAAKAAAGTSSEVLLAVNQYTRDEMIDALEAKDNYGLANLLLSGRVFPVADRTKVLVLDRDWYIVRVRVLEGPYAGKSGWVNYEALD